MRFRFIEPVESVLRVLRDVIVHRAGDHEWVAIGREPAVVGETLMLDVDDGDAWHRLTMCVIESRPIILDGDMRHRIRLHNDELPPIVFEQQISPRMSRPHVYLSYDSGVLTRQLRARAINVSRSGCLIECDQRLEVGTVGSLRLQIGSQEYLDDVEVVRCQPIQGSSMCHVGVRFLKSTARHAQSIRNAVALYGAEFAGIPTTTRVM